LSDQSSRELQSGLVSVGLPVYNGAQFLREAVDSLLAQDYTNFELIISDNASEDETESICREYAAHDARVRYYRAEQNMGPAWNFLRVYDLAGGEYFLWAAHDDRRAPRCLSLCVAALEQNPRALMCCMDARLIDENGQDVTATYPFRCYHPTGERPIERLRGLVRSSSWLDVYSLFRTPALAEPRQWKINAWGGDVVLVAQLCLSGEVVEAKEQLLDYRYFSSKTVEDVARGQSTSAKSVEVSWSNLTTDILECVQSSPLGFLEKFGVKWMVVVEFCFRNKSVGWGIGKEGFDGARRAFAGGLYGRAFTLSAIALLKRMEGFIQRVKRSLQSRSGRLVAPLQRERSSEERRRG
jgi:glycosyltransferase involved in cell wall biosynthesis